ncbi:glycine cleavage system protein GcvH [Trichlorobacter lovleyi]|uniref:glycine cleavage system protein GcvH n=1 Tax=Trichlorobacter lovleyi TaxID=313985 RepID=UPI0022400C34|nr:glycine cleavage system protein GcvH [Trichlorobacter lovleyi]QOX78612.1 glycine cleavage system protein GcvH [Trichlorobacter lovleyi]
MEFPEELKYSKEHVWLRIEGNRAVVGITDFAQEELGTIAAVELPDEGDQVEQEDSMGSVEARKTVAELYAPVTGTVLAVNEEAVDTPALLNDDPYDGGWLLELELEDRDELKTLMSADDYADYVEDKDV